MWIEVLCSNKFNFSFALHVDYFSLLLTFKIFNSLRTFLWQFNYSIILISLWIILIYIFKYPSFFFPPHLGSKRIYWTARISWSFWSTSKYVFKNNFFVFVWTIHVLFYYLSYYCLIFLFYFSYSLGNSRLWRCPRT